MAARHFLRRWWQAEPEGLVLPAAPRELTCRPPLSTAPLQARLLAGPPSVWEPPGAGSHGNLRSAGHLAPGPQRLPASYWVPAWHTPGSCCVRAHVPARSLPAPSWHFPRGFAPVRPSDCFSPAGPAAWLQVLSKGRVRSWQPPPLDPHSWQHGPQLPGQPSPTAAKLLAVLEEGRRREEKRGRKRPFPELALMAALRPWEGLARRGGGGRGARSCGQTPTRPPYPLLWSRAAGSGPGTGGLPSEARRGMLSAGRGGAAHRRGACSAGDYLWAGRHAAQPRGAARGREEKTQEKD